MPELLLREYSILLRARSFKEMLKLGLELLLAKSLLMRSMTLEMSSTEALLLPMFHTTSRETSKTSDQE